MVQQVLQNKTFKILSRLVLKIKSNFKDCIDKSKRMKSKQTFSKDGGARGDGSSF
jgi:hypothetical protein